MALLPIESTFELYRQSVGRLPTHLLSVELALGSVLAEAAVARIALPRFTQSAMDGYALRAAEGQAPRTLIGTSAAGEPSPVAVGPGQAVRILTGGVVPEGADAVARQEIVERTGIAREILRIECGVLERTYLGRRVWKRDADEFGRHMIIPMLAHRIVCGC